MCVECIHHLTTLLTSTFTTIWTDMPLHHQAQDDQYIIRPLTASEVQEQAHPLEVISYPSVSKYVCVCKKVSSYAPLGGVPNANHAAPLHNLSERVT